MSPLLLGSVRGRRGNGNFGFLARGALDAGGAFPGGDLVGVGIGADLAQDLLYFDTSFEGL